MWASIFTPGGYKEMSSIWLTNELKCVGGGGGELRGLSQRVQLYTGGQINFGDLTPYLTYDSHSEGFEWFIEGQAFLRSCDQLFAHPLPPLSRQ